MTVGRMVIVGGGLAGAKAAETLRAEGFEGSVVLVGEEPEVPYERPALSKAYLAGEDTRESLQVHPAAWYADHQVDLRTGTRAARLDLTSHEVLLEDGERLGFDRLLLATGSSPRRLSVPGAALDGVRYLRRIADSDTIKADLAGAPRQVVVAGGGWIGLEVAAAARVAGHDVAVLEPQPTVLNAALGPELGDFFAELHRSHGVRLLLGTGVAELRGDGGSVHSVVTADGQELPADLVIAGIGAAPNVDLAQRAGLGVDDGVLADERLRTSHPDVHVAGDIAHAFHPLLGRRLRVEHWANARDSGVAAARSMLGQQVSYDRVPFFYTDQYDLGMEYAGNVGPSGHDRVVYRGDRGSGKFVVFWLRDGRVVAGMNVNVWDVNDAIQALVRSGLPVDERRLADPDVPIADLVHTTA